MALQASESLFGQTDSWIELLHCINTTITRTHSVLVMDQDLNANDYAFASISKSLITLIHDLDTHFVASSQSIFAESWEPATWCQLYRNVMMTRVLQTLLTLTPSLSMTESVKQTLSTFVKGTIADQALTDSVLQVIVSPDSCAVMKLTYCVAMSQKQYAEYVEQFRLLSLYALDLSKRRHFQRAYGIILSQDSDSEAGQCDCETVLDETCAVTVALLIGNNGTQFTLQALLSEFTAKIREYYGFLQPHRAFLCFYCNKSVLTPHELLAHLRRSHERKKRGGANNVEYICYLMCVGSRLDIRTMDQSTQYYFSAFFADNL